MKRLTTIICALLLLLGACKKDDTACYEFTTTKQTTVMTRNSSGSYREDVDAVTAKSTQCGITGDEAKTIAEDMGSYTVTGEWGDPVIVRVKVWCSYKKK